MLENKRTQQLLPPPLFPILLNARIMLIMAEQAKFQHLKEVTEEKIERLRLTLPLVLRDAKNSKDNVAIYPQRKLKKIEKQLKDAMRNTSNKKEQNNEEKKK